MKCNTALMVQCADVAAASSTFMCHPGPPRSTEKRSPCRVPHAGNERPAHEEGISTGGGPFWTRQSTG